MGKLPRPDDLFAVVRNRFNYPFYRKKATETLDGVKEKDGNKEKKKRQKKIYIMDTEKWYSKASKKDLEMELNLAGETEDDRKDMHRIIQFKIRQVFRIFPSVLGM